MAVTVQIRNVPYDLRRRLKARAAQAGMTLSDYLLREIHHLAERPSVEELRARLRSRSTVTLSVSPSDAVRSERGPAIALDAESGHRRTLDALADVEAGRTIDQKQIEAWAARLGKPKPRGRR